MRPLFNLLFNLFALLIVVMVCSTASWAQAPYKNIGRAATPEEIKTADISIGISGKELPPGSGIAADGAKIYAAKCAVCHGADGHGGIGSPLVGGKGTLASQHPVRTIGSYWPFATTVYDYINRAMPKGNGGSLSPNEVYALTAFLLYKNDIIKETDVVDAKSLPKVQMPNRNGFIPGRVEDIPDIEKRGCQIGNCP
jgi:mono/diheme cytochrome c family protein